MEQLGRKQERLHGPAVSSDEADHQPNELGTDPVDALHRGEVEFEDGATGLAEYLAGCEFEANPVAGRTATWRQV